MRISRRSMVMDVRLFAVVLVFLGHVVVVAVRQDVVIVRVGMPVRPVLPLTQQAPGVMVRHMIMVMRMHFGAVGMLHHLALAFGPLFDSQTAPRLSTILCTAQRPIREQRTSEGCYPRCSIASG